MMTVLAIIIVIGGVVIAHELGHFLFAKMMGMRVEVFSIGFPPKILGKKIGDTEYRLSLIPLGGYVKVTGVIDESMDVDTTAIKEPYSFLSKKAWQKALFISGGVIFNLLLAVIIFTVATFVAGIYEPVDKPVIESVVPGMPADSVGILPGDVILAINNEPIETWQELFELIHAHPHDSILIKWRSGEVEKSAKVLPVANKILKRWSLVEVGLIGISPTVNHRSAGFFEAFGNGFKNTFYWCKVTLVSLKMLITGQESIKSIGGPILIARLAGESAKSGIGSIFLLMAIISVNLALINILPIPAFDGGHLIIIFIESVIRRPLSTKAKLRIQQIGMALIVLLTLLILYNDIARIFKW